mmetsp:Transcript_28610/g.55810  ORF Transcript_28610/g.55810 Transcript_28610/m.55810 type:complete len:211 (-) Transcript_28610:219-851(-)
MCFIPLSVDPPYSSALPRRNRRSGFCLSFASSAQHTLAASSYFFLPISMSARIDSATLLSGQIGTIRSTKYDARSWSFTARRSRACEMSFSTWSMMANSLTASGHAGSRSRSWLIIALASKSMPLSRKHLVPRTYPLTNDTSSATAALLSARASSYFLSIIRAAALFPKNIGSVGSFSIAFVYASTASWYFPALYRALPTALKSSSSDIF